LGKLELFKVHDVIPFEDYNNNNLKVHSRYVRDQKLTKEGTLKIELVSNSSKAI
jgi:hypothetical protein